jgi:hypothetical protein
MSALMQAVDEGDLEKIKRLVAEGGNVKEIYPSGFKVLLIRVLYPSCTGF